MYLNPESRCYCLQFVTQDRLDGTILHPKTQRDFFSKSGISQHKKSSKHFFLSEIKKSSIKPTSPWVRLNQVTHPPEYIEKVITHDWKSFSHTLQSFFQPFHIQSLFSPILDNFWGSCFFQHQFIRNNFSISWLPPSRKVVQGHFELLLCHVVLLVDFERKKVPTIKNHLIACVVALKHTTNPFYS